MKFAAVLPDSLGYMAAPMLICVIITGLLTYLGLHVLEREVIFVDLALAQIAALGATYAFFLGLDPASPSGYVYSLAFASVGAALFSMTRYRRARIPQEAIIGIAYAVASGAAILLVDLARDPHGGEKVQYLLVGKLVWVTWPEVAKTAVICGLVGSVHYVFRRQLLLVTFQEGEAERQGYSLRWWDFVFYFSFGLAITSIVSLTGVLLIFSYLIIPAAIGTLFAASVRGRVLIGWVVGLVVSFVGLLISYDRPSGPTIVTLFGTFLIGFGAVRYIISSSSKARAATIVALVLGSCTFIVVGIPSLAGHSIPFFAGTPKKAGAASEHHQHIHDTVGVPSVNAPTAAGPVAEWAERLSAQDAVEREQAIQEIETRRGSNALKAITRVLELENDAALRLRMAKLLAEHGHESAGLEAMISLLRDSEIPFVRKETLDYLKTLSGEDFGYDPLKPSDANGEALQHWEQWIEERLDEKK